MAGAWKMNDDGSFELNEPYKTMVMEARLSATYAWRESLYSYLADKVPYTRDQMNESLLRMIDERDETGPELVELFVVRALEGDL